MTTPWQPVSLSWDARDSPSGSPIVLPAGQGAYVALERPLGSTIIKLPIEPATERRSIKRIEVFVHFVEQEETEPAEPRVHESAFGKVTVSDPVLDPAPGTRVRAGTYVGTVMPRFPDDDPGWSKVRLDDPPHATLGFMSMHLAPIVPMPGPPRTPVRQCSNHSCVVHPGCRVAAERCACPECRAAVTVKPSGITHPGPAPEVPPPLGPLSESERAALLRADADRISPPDHSGDVETIRAALSRIEGRGKR